MSERAVPSSENGKAAHVVKQFASSGRRSNSSLPT